MCHLAMLCHLSSAALTRIFHFITTPERRCNFITIALVSTYCSMVRGLAGSCRPGSAISPFYRPCRRPRRPRSVIWPRRRSCRGSPTSHWPRCALCFLLQFTIWPHWPTSPFYRSRHCCWPRSACDLAMWPHCPPCRRPITHIQAPIFARH